MQLKNAAILVVDDEDLLRDYIGRWFEREGATVYRAGNGKEALDLLTSHHVDLIVSDIRMPVLDGVGMLKAIRADERSHLSVIFLSGFNDYSERELFDLGAEALLPKPFDRSRLMHAAVTSLAQRNDLWRIPMEAAPDQPLVSRSFASLVGAITTGQIAFGRGGFSLKTDDVLEKGTVSLDLRFREEAYALLGCGVVRWVEPRDMQMGIELCFVADQSRAQVVALTEGRPQFIPGAAGG